MQRPQRIQPAAGQESVWDYPRPPRLEASTKRVKIIFGGQTIVETDYAMRVLETSHPPVYYVPPDSIMPGVLVQLTRRTYCEFKGQAGYYTVKVGDKVAEAAAWFYPNPTPGITALQNYVAFYPSRMDACYLNDELVKAQAGDFYGGWITSDIVGPFKGEPGTMFW